MKKFLTGSLVAVMIFLSACGSANNTPVSSETSSEVSSVAVSSQVVSQAPAVTVQPVELEGWLAVPSDLPVLYMKDYTASILVYNVPNTATMDEAIAAAKDKYDDTYFEIKYSDIEQTTADNRTASRFTFTGLYSAEPMKFNIVVVTVGKYFYVVEFKDYANAYDKNIGDFETFLKGIRFTETAE